MPNHHCPFCSKMFDAETYETHRVPCRDHYYSADDALRAEPKLKATVTTTACNILELLDNREGYCEARGITLRAKGKRLTTIEAPRRSLERLASEFTDRDDAGWDQPTAWRTSARRAAEAIREVLKTA